MLMLIALLFGYGSAAWGLGCILLLGCWGLLFLCRGFVGGFVGLILLALFGIVFL